MTLGRYILGSGHNSDLRMSDCLIPENENRLPGRVTGQPLATAEALSAKFILKPTSYRVTADTLLTAAFNAHKHH